MALLTNELLVRLPMFAGEERHPDPIVFARLYMPGTAQNWYVLGGEMALDQDFFLYCYFTTAEEDGFSYFLLSTLESTVGPAGQHVIFDPEFPEIPLSDVMPTPDS